MKHKGNGATNISVETDETVRLREILQKAVKREKAPESLREKIRKMIRE